MVFELLCITTIALLFATALIFGGYRFFLFLLPIWGFFGGFVLGSSAIEALFNTGLFATVTGWVVGFVVGAIFALTSYFFYAAADVTFCGSGNLGQVYFHTFDHRTTLDELNQAFPGMVEAVIAHEGVGLVVATQADGAPVAYGKGGKRNLHTGEVSGQDPLLPYGDVELRLSLIHISEPTRPY